MTPVLTAEPVFPMTTTGVVVTLLGLLVTVAWLAYLYR